MVMFMKVLLKIANFRDMVNILIAKLKIIMLEDGLKINGMVRENYLILMETLWLMLCLNRINSFPKCEIKFIFFMKFFWYNLDLELFYYLYFRNISFFYFILVFL
jgi:hypothetical protein